MERKIKPVFWTAKSIKDLEKITRFNIQLYGFKKAIDIALEIRKHTEILENPTFEFSEIGSVDEAFLELKHEYRKLIYKNCKITYPEGTSKIYMNRVFDTRQNPKKNK